jgi:hypothetical protein
MKRTCPTCNQQLPKVETIQYRFCPHCGAEIDAGPRPLDEAFLTVPPDSPLAPADAGPEDPGPAPEKTKPVSEPFDDQTIAPQLVSVEKRPQIRPPAEPPPPGFFRTPPSAPEPPPPKTKKQRIKKTHPPPAKPPKKTATKNHQKVIIAVLIALAVVILLLGGLFTF